MDNQEDINNTTNLDQGYDVITSPWSIGVLGSFLAAASIIGLYKLCSRSLQSGTSTSRYEARTGGGNDSRDVPSTNIQPTPYQSGAAISSDIGFASI